MKPMELIFRTKCGPGMLKLPPLAGQCPALRCSKRCNLHVDKRAYATDRYMQSIFSKYD